MTTNDLADRHLDIDLAEGIHLQRDEHGVATNVPHLVVHHSPTGFEWGYGGSGPADLALNIAEAILQRTGYKGARVQCYDGDCFTLAWQMHQDLKWQFIGPMPRAGGVIPYSDVHGWLVGEAIKLRIPDDDEPATICDRCGTEIAHDEANYAGPELPLWEGATLCNDCYAGCLAIEPQPADPDWGLDETPTD